MKKTSTFIWEVTLGYVEEDDEDDNGHFYTLVIAAAHMTDAIEFALEKHPGAMPVEARASKSKGIMFKDDVLNFLGETDEEE